MQQRFGGAAPSPQTFSQGLRIFLQKSAPVDSWRSNLSNGKCLKYAFDLTKDLIVILLRLVTGLL